MTSPNHSELQTIARLLYDRTGIVISDAKSSMVQSRLGKRMRKLGIADFSGYVSLISGPDGEHEVAQMISALTTNVTQFFREAHHFDQLRKEVLPPLIDRARRGGRVRIWSAGCSSGQEPFSIAMLLCAMMPEAPGADIRILATDIDPAMIACGAAGLYEADLCAAIPQEMRERFLKLEGDQVRIPDSLREMVRFRELNLHGPWPMRGRFDVIFCRNVVIYFDATAQTRLWTRFEEALAPGGWLFVGHSERVPLSKHGRLQTAGNTSYRLKPDSGKDPECH